MWFIGVEVVEQETSASPPKKNPGSAPAIGDVTSGTTDVVPLAQYRPVLRCECSFFCWE